MKTNETLKQQVKRVLKEMVAAGELTTKKNSSGETLYGLPLKNSVKMKVSKPVAKARREAALKAWVTRRRRAAAKLKVAKCSKWEARSAAAKKAWVTRRTKAYILTGSTAGSCSKTKASISSSKIKLQRANSFEFVRPVHGVFQDYLEKALVRGGESLEHIKSALLAVGIIR